MCMVKRIHYLPPTFVRTTLPAAATTTITVLAAKIEYPDASQKDLDVQILFLITMFKISKFLHIYSKEAYKLTVWDFLMNKTARANGLSSIGISPRSE